MNVNITNIRSAGGFSRTGALAGRLTSAGTVSGSHVAGGSITHTESGNTASWLGRLSVGLLRGCVSDSYATCNVVGNSQHQGGGA